MNVKLHARTYIHKIYFGLIKYLYRNLAKASVYPNHTSAWTLTGFCIGNLVFSHIATLI